MAKEESNKMKGTKDFKAARNGVTKEAVKESLFQELKQLNLVDKFLFDETMEDRDAYQAMVGILLGDEVELLDKPETEKELRVSDALRQVRLDVVSCDSGGRIYYSEMQQRNTGNLKKRSRFYQAQLDVSLLKPGVEDFNELNDSCFILIAPFDIFHKELYCYSFEAVCRECPEITLKDGSLRVFINTKGKNREDFSEEFLDFMEYITNTTDEVAECTKSQRIKRIHERVREVRQSEEMGVRYMQRWEELVYARQDGREEGEARGKLLGRAEGKTIGKENALRSLMETMRWSLEEAMNALQISGEERVSLAKRMNTPLSTNESEFTRT